LRQAKPLSPGTQDGDRAAAQEDAQKMYWPGTGRLTGVVLAIALTIAPAAAQTAVASPNPHDHGFVPALMSNGQPARAPGASQLSRFSGALGTPPLVYQGGSVAPSSTVYAIF
jgi:hypothetical protein